MTDRIDFTVIGDEKLRCSGCETRIRFALDRIAGVQHVAADDGTQRVTIMLDPSRVSRDHVQE